MIISWGDYNGQEIEDLPTDYLRSLVKNCEFLIIRREAQLELDNRESKLEEENFWDIIK
jgi:hypothetical protein|tara:strand:- start:1071 stop:1247 length:177 start_codon:yes stop_codon:yes gene_type:complete